MKIFPTTLLLLQMYGMMSITSTLSPSIEDKNTILAGPRWSVLKDFHNKWEDLGSAGSLPEDELLPDDFPRTVGDNNVIFAERPNNPNGELQVSIRDLVDNFNHFSELTMRPEPKNHSVLPSLVGIKVSAVPTWTSDNKSSGTLSICCFLES